MTATKKIVNSIYYGGLLIAILLDLNNIQFYFGIVFVIIQIVFVTSDYIITRREIIHETALFKNDDLTTMKDLFLVIPFFIAIFIGTNLWFKIFSTNLLVLYLLIGVISIIIQFLITRHKIIPSFLIEKNILIVNELFLKTYNLENLESISFDGFSENYVVKFNSNKIIQLKQEDYKQEELNKFIVAMIRKSNSTVALSNNIKQELTATNIGFAAMLADE